MVCYADWLKGLSREEKTTSFTTQFKYQILHIDHTHIPGATTEHSPQKALPRNINYTEPQTQSSYFPNLPRVLVLPPFTTKPPPVLLSLTRVCSCLPRTFLPAKQEPWTEIPSAEQLPRGSAHALGTATAQGRWSPARCVSHKIKTWRCPCPPFSIYSGSKDHQMKISTHPVHMTGALQWDQNFGPNKEWVFSHCSETVCKHNFFAAPQVI